VLAASVALYASWTPIGKAVIDAVQGRYMLPVLPSAWAGCARLRSAPRATAVIGLDRRALFPRYRWPSCRTAIMARYYGSWSQWAQRSSFCF